MKTFVLIAVVIFLGCSISGCGSYSNSNNSQAAPTLAGNWQFTYTSSKGASMSLSVTGTLSQTGSSFSGTVSITGACVTSGTISGTLSGLSITNGTLTGANLTISVTGSTVSNYNSASGSYQVMMASGACAALVGDSGAWTGSRTVGSGGGGYFGILRSADRIPVQLALNLKEDGGQVSGTANFTNSACLHSMNVAGTLSGVNLELKGDGGADGSIVLSGTTDAEGKTLTLNSTVSGTCQAESGVGTLIKMQ